MEPDKLKAIAEKSGTSVSTVRRVLGHCSGVALETRQAVIKAQCELNHPLATTGRRLYFILPDNPKFFWHKALDVLNGYLFDPPVKLSFYPSLRRRDLLKTYLEPIADEENAVLILAADLNEEEAAVVRRIAGRSLVIQLCQHADLENTVYVGADAYTESYELGKLAAAAARHAVILKPYEGLTADERCRGFAAGFGGKVTVLPEPEEERLYASFAARALAPLTDADAVFAPGGHTAEVCLAVHKLRRPLRCFGYEVPPQLEKTVENSVEPTVVQQNIAEQTRTALALARAYLQDGTLPSQKAYLIPSRLLTVNKKG